MQAGRWNWNKSHSCRLVAQWTSVCTNCPCPVWRNWSVLNPIFFLFLHSTESPSKLPSPWKITAVLISKLLPVAGWWIKKSTKKRGRRSSEFQLQLYRFLAARYPSSHDIKQVTYFNLVIAKMSLISPCTKWIQWYSSGFPWDSDETMFRKNCNPHNVKHPLLQTAPVLTLSSRWSL